MMVQELTQQRTAAPGPAQGLTYLMLLFVSCSSGSLRHSSSNWPRNLTSSLAMHLHQQQQQQGQPGHQALPVQLHQGHTW
jgi:hypothetical protein